MRLERRQILVQHLLLERHGRGGHHQPLATGLGHRQGGKQVGQSLARAGPGLEHADMLIAGPPPGIVGLDASQGAGDFGNHQRWP